MNIQSQACGTFVEEVGTVFNFLTPEEIMELCPYLSLKEVDAGSVLMEKGDPSDYMAFLISGKLAVKKETEFPGKYVVVAILEGGSMVGETAVFEQSRRSATVKVMEDSRLLILTSKDIDQLSEANSVLCIKILKRVLHILKLRLRQGSDRLSRLL